MANVDQLVPFEGGGPLKPDQTDSERKKKGSSDFAWTGKSIRTQRHQKRSKDKGGEAEGRLSGDVITQTKNQGAGSSSGTRLRVFSRSPHILLKTVSGGPLSIANSSIKSSGQRTLFRRRKDC